jgi:hypothetical protein
MVSKIKSLAQITSKSLNSKNKTLIDTLIKNYQDKTMSAVEKIIDMCVAVKSVDEKLKTGEINEEDMDYFCASISLNRKSSTYRKYMCIGEKSNVLMKYMEKLPSASSVLYEITTLNPDVFEQLIEDGNLHTHITLDQLKKLTQKVPKKNKLTDDVELKITMNIKNMSEESKLILKNFMIDVYKSKEMFLTCTDKSNRVLQLEKVQSLVLNQSDEVHSVPSRNNPEMSLSIQE